MSNFLTEVKILNHGVLETTIQRKLILQSISKSMGELSPSRLSDDHISRLIGPDRTYNRIYVIGFGKASLSMYYGIREKILDKLEFAGIIIPVGEKPSLDCPELSLLYGNHPIIGPESISSTEYLVSRLKGLKENDLVIVLISGGGSALFELPSPGITLEKIREISKCLMNSGADIYELNAIRQILSQVKGGKFAHMLMPATVESFVISDVPGDDVSVIASGPLSKPVIGSTERKKIIEKFSDKCHLLREIDQESLDYDLSEEAFKRVKTSVILKNGDFVDKICDYLRKQGENVIMIKKPITGDVQDVSKIIVETLRTGYNSRPVWVVAGGETTVKVQGKGIGGRNCELALRVSRNMGPDERFTFASIGTDGIDGTSPAMGGIVDNGFKEHLRPEIVDEYLRNNDSFTLLSKYNAAIITGYTGTNVSDIFIGYYAGKAMEN